MKEKDSGISRQQFLKVALASGAVIATGDLLVSTRVTAQGEELHIADFPIAPEEKIVLDVKGSFVTVHTAILRQRPHTNQLTVEFSFQGEVGAGRSINVTAYIKDPAGSAFKALGAEASDIRAQPRIMSLKGSKPFQLGTSNQIDFNLSNDDLARAAYVELWFREGN